MRFIFSLSFLFFTVGLSAQKTNPSVDFLTPCIQHIDTFNRNFPHEKVYLHFDNTCYFLGDTLWFKAYLTNAIHHIPDNWSRTLYVELLTQEGDILETKKFKVTDGQCHGQFALKDSLWAGFYEIRAYTRWMLNFGEGHAFSRVFPVFTKPYRKGDYQYIMKRRNFEVPDYRRKDMWKWEKSGKKVVANFFPEGGHLVKGLTSRVAFKIVSNKDEDLSAQGRLTDSLGNEIYSFPTVHNGMGIFEYTPNGLPHVVEFEVEGKKWSFTLPAAQEEGCVIKVDALKTDAIRLILYRSAALKQETLGITVSCRGQVYSAISIEPTTNSETVVAIPCQDLPSGVTQIVLFNAQKEVLAERLVFVNHHNKLKIGVTREKTTYTPFEKINLKFNINDSQNNPVQTVFSLAVRDGSKSVANVNADILTYLLLSSEIKGYVKDPYYYFQGNTQRHKYSLDLLMLTQGWSRYIWKQMAGSEKFTITQPAEESISMDGWVQTYGLKPKPRKGAEVMMWMTGPGGSHRSTCTTDEYGQFLFAFDFWGDWKLSLQVKQNDKRKNSDIRLNRFFSPPMRKLSFYEKQIPEENLIAQQVKIIDTVVKFNPSTTFNPEGFGAKNVARNYKLEEVQVKARKAFRQEDVGLENASVAYHLDEELDILQDQGKNNATDLFEFLAKNNPYYYTQRPITTNQDRYKSRKVMYVTNNMLASEYTIPLREIGLDRIKLITIDETFGAARTYVPMIEDDPVVIHIYTDNNLQKTPASGIRTTKIKGYALVKEFYNPSYDWGVFPGEKDYRRTLYWNPNVTTDSLGQAQVSFYNNSSCRQINVSAETITSSGAIGTTGL